MLKNEIYIGNHHLVPGHMSLKDWYIYYKYRLGIWWYKHFGKYTIVDSSKYWTYDKSRWTFSLSDKQMKQLEAYSPNEYIFIPTHIGWVFKIKDMDGELIDLTDYDSW